MQAAWRSTSYRCPEAPGESNFSSAVAGLSAAQFRFAPKSILPSEHRQSNMSQEEVGPVPLPGLGLFQYGHLLMEGPRPHAEGEFRDPCISTTLAIAPESYVLGNCPR